jgi:hypothetical protein
MNCFYVLEAADDIKLAAVYIPGITANPRRCYDSTNLFSETQ